MHPDRAAGDELAAWAARRAPDVLAQAQAEAVAALRSALVAAAIDEGGQPATAPVVRPPESASVRTDNEDRPGNEDARELLWAYCVLRAADPHPDALSGVHDAGTVDRVQAGDLAALVSRVPRSQFSAEPLRRNLNDLAWLERTARAHEAVLDAALDASTIVPLRMCTVYENEESVERMLRREREVFLRALDTLDGRLEWAVKVIVDSDRLMDAAGDQVGFDGTAEEDAAARGEGGAYMLRRRRERRVRERATALAGEVAEQVHARLQDWAIDAVTRPPQNRELSRHEGEMVLNAAYLVERAQTDELRSLVAELEEHHRELGARIELTGPWPPYNFVPGGAATLA